MIDASLVRTIEDAFERRESIDARTDGEVRNAVETALDMLDRGEVRVAEKGQGSWTVNQWLKKAVLLSFRLNDMAVVGGGPGGANWWDKVPSKFVGWGEDRFREAGFRAVPGCVVRRSAFIAPGVVLMPCFVNVGAYVDRGNDGRHLGDGRLLRPDRQELPYFWRRRHRRRAGAVAGRTRRSSRTTASSAPAPKLPRASIVGQGSVLSMGVYLGASTKIVDRATGEVFMGRVPPYSVVVSGTMPGSRCPMADPGPHSIAPSSSSASTSGPAPRPRSTSFLRD